MSDQRIPFMQLRERKGGAHLSGLLGHARILAFKGGLTPDDLLVWEHFLLTRNGGKRSTELVHLTTLWQRASPSKGSECMAGYLGKARLLGTRSTMEGVPAWRFYIQAGREQEAASEEGRQ
jgi:hypothetical protein